MKIKIFSIYDSKAEAYLQPFFMMSKGQAMRAFDTAVNTAGDNFCKYAADYTLFELGEFDDTHAIFTTLNAPVSICNGIELKKGDNSNA